MPLRLAAAEARVHIFIRAFIPSQHPGNPGYIRSIPGHPGEFVIPNPVGSGCFMTDNRTFSRDISASSRAATEILLVTLENTARVERADGRAFFRTGTSRKVDCQTGMDLVAPQTAPTSMMHFGHPAIANGVAEVVIDGRANNPIPPTSPDIQYGGSFLFNTTQKTLRFRGGVAVFPAYEAYAQLQGGPLITIFQASPGSGSTAASLIDFGTGIKLQPLDITVQLKSTFTLFRTISKQNNKIFRLEGEKWSVIDVDTNSVEHTLFETSKDENFLYLTLRDPTDALNEQRISLTGGPWQFKLGGTWQTLASKTEGE
jgi:hypothetical protein